MVKCPICGAEVEYFIRKPRSKYAKCPVCGKSFLIKDHPELQPYIKVVDDKEEETEETEREETSKEEETKEEKPKRKRVELFEPPKSPEDIIYEVMNEWGLDEDFINHVVRYVQRKGGYLDAGWLMNMLLNARTGRRLTQQEAYLIVDEIISAIEQEKRKAEEMGRMYPPFFITPLPQSSRPVYPPYTYTSTPQQTHMYYTPTPQPSYQPSYSMSSTSVQSFPQSYQPAPQITPQMIQEWIRQSLQEFKRASDIDELKKMIMEIEKKRVEDRAELEKLIAKSREETLKEIKEIIANISTQPVETIDKKDIDLMKTELEKTYIQKINELEKKYLEAKSESEKKELMKEIDRLRGELESLKEGLARPVSPEGWQKDETRLVAELGSRFLDILRERRPLEYIVRIVPKPAPQEERKTEKDIEELIREAGGVIE